MARKLLLAGNWKMQKTAREAAAYAREFLPRVKAISTIDLLLCPPFTALAAMADALKGSVVQLGAQDVCWKESGALTGEISVSMLKEFSISHILVGHSERRQYLDEGNALIAEKMKVILVAGLIPILCVGENAMHRKTKRHLTFVQGQLAAAFKDLNASDAVRTVIAYEPIWAIGTGNTATQKQAQEMHAGIRAWLSKHYNSATAERMRIIYGGSANADNCRTLLEQPDIDGLLPGGASLDPAVFATMAEIA